MRRGLARSSVVILELAGIEKDRASELSKLQADLSQKLDSLEAELNRLEEERQSALASLDIAQAAELAKNVESKMNELEKTKAEVIKFNNGVAETEAKYNKSIEKERLAKQEEQQKELEKRRIDNENAKKQQKIAVLTNYFSQFGKDAIKKLTADSSLADLVGMDIFYGVYRNLL